MKHEKRAWNKSMPSWSMPPIEFEREMSSSHFREDVQLFEYGVINVQMVARS